MDSPAQPHPEDATTQGRNHQKHVRGAGLTRHGQPTAAQNSKVSTNSAAFDQPVDGGALERELGLQDAGGNHTSTPTEGLFQKSAAGSSLQGPKNWPHPRVEAAAAAEGVLAAQSASLMTKYQDVRSKDPRPQDCSLSSMYSPTNLHLAGAENAIAGLVGSAVVSHFSAMGGLIGIEKAINNHMRPMPPLISLDLAPAADVYDAVDKNLLFEDLKKQILDNERSMRAEGFAKGGWSVVSLPADAHQCGAILRRHLREMKGCLGMCKLIVHSHFRQKRICPVVLIARLNLLANIRINFFKLANIKGLTPVGIQHLDNFFLPMLSKLHGCAMIGSHRKTPYTMVIEESQIHFFDIFGLIRQNWEWCWKEKVLGKVRLWLFEAPDGPLPAAWVQ